MVSVGTSSKRKASSVAEADELQLVSPGGILGSSNKKARVDYLLNAESTNNGTATRPLTLTLEEQKALEIEKADSAARVEEQKKAKEEEQRKQRDEKAKREREELQAKYEAEVRRLEAERKKREEREQERMAKANSLFAREVHWTDILDWKDSTASPLMQLPAELLDLCFGSRKGTDHLELADYVALSGVSRYFRHHLDDQFFREIQGMSVSVNSKPGEAPAPPIARCPFSRNLKKWRTKPKRITLPSSSLNAYYVPRGDRSEWTEAQYTVYKEEKAKWRKEAIAKAVKAEKPKRARNSPDTKASPGYVGRRRVLAIVDGRKDGHPAVVKDYRGIPVNPQPPRTLRDGKEEEEVESAAARLWAQVKDTNTTTHFPTSRDLIDGEPDPEELERAGRRLWAKVQQQSFRRSGRTEGGLNVEAKQSVTLGNTASTKWTTPDSDDEDEEDLPFVNNYDHSGHIVPHDYWPSPARRQAAEIVNRGSVKKGQAMTKYKVSEAELITLRHVLLTNPMNTTSPQLLFSETAVKALAYRAHGGVQGHKAHMKRAKDISAKAASTRQAKIAEAKRNGTYKPPTPKCSCPHWWYGECVCYGKYGSGFNIGYSMWY